MKQDAATAQIASVKSYSHPYDYCHDRNQDYYREGLRLHLEQHDGNLEIAPVSFSRTLRLLRRARNSSRLSGVLGPVSHRVNSLMDGFAGCLGARCRPCYPAVGQYAFRFTNGRQIIARIDTHDSGQIRNPSGLAESDVYFKTNYWIDGDYDDKTVPMYNCDPLMLHHLGMLRQMRRRPARYDVCLVVRVWGEQVEVEGVEHCVRLLEAVARACGRKYLLATLQSPVIRKH